MRYLIFILFCTSCTTYQNFVPVTDLYNVPRGSTQFFIQTDMEAVKGALRANTITYYQSDYGLETEDIFLDEGTRAKYNIYPLDSVTVKVVPHWAITQKVIGQATAWVGTIGASGMSTEWQRVVYKTSEIRPKKVFDYGVGLFKDLGHVSY